MTKDKSTDARYICINGNYYSKAKIKFYQANPLTDEQLALLQTEEANMRRALQSHNCSRPSLKALQLMGEIFNRPVNSGCQRCIVGIVSEAAEMYFYHRDKAIEDANAKAFVAQTKDAEAPKPKAAPKKKPSTKKK